MALRILSIDGGGIRGVIPAYWLSQLETRLGSLQSKFDVFAGTSTGAIIAAGLACGLTAAQIYHLYRTSGPEIFRRKKLWRFLPSLRASCGLRPKYGREGLDRVLLNTFQERTLADITPGKRLIIVALDAYNRRQVVFDSEESDYGHHRLRDLCRASAAAPTYFPPHALPAQGIVVPFLDGGLAGNNPSTVALARALRSGLGLNEVLLVSLGTGSVHETIDAPKVTQQVEKRGWLTWASPLIDLLFDGSSAINDDVSASILGSDYFRFQVRLPKNLGALDDVRSTHLENLVAEARNYWNAAKSQVDNLVKALSDEGTLTGSWRSTFTWGRSVSPRLAVAGVRFDESRSGEVRVRQFGSIISGESVDPKGSPDQYTFKGSLRGDDIIGEWKSQHTALCGTFQLRRDIETPNKVCSGFWSGTGAEGLYVGTWTLERAGS